MQPSTDTSESALITGIRANLCDFFRHLSRALHTEGREQGVFTRWHTPLPHPWFNGVLASTPFTETDQTFIQETIDYFKSKNVRTFTWWLDPALQSTDWRPALTQHAFGYADDTPGMAVDLHALHSPAAVDGLEIRAVEDEAGLRAWAQTFVRGYGLPLDWAADVFNVWQALEKTASLKNYLGYWRSQPVATSSLFCGGGNAGIYSVSTLPEARGLGIGAALTAHPLLEARELGYRIGTLQSSAMGFNIYQKLGFRHLCQIENFYKTTS